jgi:hypothetical protein
MRVPLWIKPAVFGAVGIMIVGFSWMGWNLGHDLEIGRGRE